MKTIEEDVMKIMTSGNLIDYDVAENVAKEVAEKFERFVEWCIGVVIKEWSLKIYIDGDSGKEFDTLSDLYQYWCDKVDGK